MNNEKGSKPNYGSPNMMDTIKTNIMTMMMINGSKSGTGDNGAMTMVYLFVVTQVLDFLMKMLPFLVQRFEKVYNDKIKSMKELAEASISITSMKYKTSSITINVALKDQENETGQALLDYTTNSCYTKHISFRNKIFVLNQTDPIEIYKDIFVVMKESLNTSDDDNDSNETNQNVELYSYELTIEKLREFLEELKTKYIIRKNNKLGNNRYYFNLIPILAFRSIENQKDYSKLPENFVFSMKKFQTNRKFSNLFGEDIDIIRKRVNFFMNNKDWYNEKGIPYTLGLLLSGSPGTGKTSTIKCLTNETNRHIININLNNDITKRQFENLFYNETIHILNTSTRQNETYCIPFDERLYVFEDVDCQSDVVNKRSDIEENPVTVDIEKKGVKHDKKEEIDDSLKIDLSFLLNLLDGVLETPGRIIIMTSNYPDMLDEALIRPGRIDVKAKFKKCSISTIMKMLEFFYNTKLTDEFKKIINEFKPESLTPAELGKIMFENVHDIDNVIRILQSGSEVRIDKDNSPCLEKQKETIYYHENIQIEIIPQLGGLSEKEPIENKESILPSYRGHTKTQTKIISQLGDFGEKEKESFIPFYESSNSSNFTPEIGDSNEKELKIYREKELEIYREKELEIYRIHRINRKPRKEYTEYIERNIQNT